MPRAQERASFFVINMPTSDERLKRIIEAHGIQVVLWDLDGTLVPGMGLDAGQSLSRKIRFKRRLTTLFRNIPHVQHIITSRNRLFLTENKSTFEEVRRLGFHGYVVGLFEKLDTTKGLYDGRDALLIDDRASECYHSVSSYPKTSVSMAVRVNGKKGFFASIDNNEVTWYKSSKRYSQKKATKRS